MIYLERLIQENRARAYAFIVICTIWFLWPGIVWFANRVPIIKFQPSCYITENNDLEKETLSGTVSQEFYSAFIFSRLSRLEGGQKRVVPEGLWAFHDAGDTLIAIEDGQIYVPLVFTVPYSLLNNFSGAVNRVFTSGDTESAAEAVMGHRLHKGVDLSAYRGNHGAYPTYKIPEKGTPAYEAFHPRADECQLMKELVLEGGKFADRNAFPAKGSGQ